MPFTNSNYSTVLVVMLKERLLWAFEHPPTPPPTPTVRLKIMDENKFIPWKSLCHENFDFTFFYESVSSKPLSIPLGPFWIFEKIRNGPIGILRSLGETDSWNKFTVGVVDTDSKFTTGVVDTGRAPWLANISANFRKKFERIPLFRGLGEYDSWKKPEFSWHCLFNKRPHRHKTQLRHYSVLVHVSQ